MVSPQARREQIQFVRIRGLSQRRACGLLGVPRSTVGYRLRQPVKDASALTAMRRLSAQYPRYGYRRIRIFLRREGLPMGINRARRLAVRPHSSLAYLTPHEFKLHHPPIHDDPTRAISQE